MNRRELLKLLLSGAAGHALDLDRLLWVPGAKKIFIPSTHLSMSAIAAMEFERVLPKIRMLFERDDMFYRIMKNQQVPIMSSRPMRVQLSFEDEE